MTAPKLSQYRADFNRGGSKLREYLWVLVSKIAFSDLVPINSLRVFLTRVFGAKIGNGVIIKPGVKIKFPWRLSIGANSWIGEDAWIDNLATVRIESDVCISQGVYICTGNHNWTKPSFDLEVSSVTVRKGAWLAARVIVPPGSVIKEGVVIGMGLVAPKTTEAYTIYSANIAGYRVNRRVISD